VRRRLLHAPWQSARMVGCRSSSRVGPTPRMAANSGSVARGAKASRSTDRALCLHGARQRTRRRSRNGHLPSSMRARTRGSKHSIRSQRAFTISAPTSACAVKLTSRLSPAFVWRTCTQGSTSRSTARAGASNTTSSSRRARILARSRCAQRDPGRNSTTTALCWSVRAPCVCIGRSPINLTAIRGHPSTAPSRSTPTATSDFGSAHTTRLECW